MTAKPTLTVAEAAILTGKSKSLIHRHIRAGRLKAQETSAGTQLDRDTVVEFFTKRRPGRPPATRRKPPQLD